MKARYAFVALAAVMFLLSGANLLYTAHRADAERQKLVSDCAFYGDLTGVPIVAAPPAKRPAELGVKLVSDARRAWHGHGCPGTIDAPSPSFVQWARYYRLPVN